MYVFPSVTGGYKSKINELVESCFLWNPQRIHPCLACLPVLTSILAVPFLSTDYSNFCLHGYMAISSMSMFCFSSFPLKNSSHSRWSTYLHLFCYILTSYICKKHISKRITFWDLADKDLDILFGVNTVFHSNLYFILPKFMSFLCEKYTDTIPTLSNINYDNIYY